MNWNKIQEILDRITNLEKLVSNDVETYLTFEQAREYLGLSKPYLYELTSKRLVPFYKPTGKKLLFKKSELIQWIEKEKHKDKIEFQKEIYDSQKIKPP
ncbi:MAG: helix-turn-helix domain-containing protein [Ignavibacteriales bacterium]|nr:helix-turn-helix domain-containing protein [Ignavibacteriales bacterium]